MSNDGKRIINPYAKEERKRSDGNEKESPSSTDPVMKSNKETRDAGHVGNDQEIIHPENNILAQASALIISASDKAGMEGIDRKRIDAIILRESGNSQYIQSARRRDEKVNGRILQLRQRLKEASPREREATEELDESLRGYQQRQAIRATCVVVDMDMFYMACELLSRPNLKNKPACVGKEMILTSNYVARRFGVRSAMAGFIGRKLVKELSGDKLKLIQVPSNFDLYKEKSRIVNEVIREYDPHHMKSYSLDEVYLDIGPYLVLFLQHKDYTHEQIREALIIYPAEVMRFLQQQSSMVCLKAADQVVFRLRQHVQKATGGLTCSAGIARTHTIAKIASDKNKPNGQLLVDPVSTLAFVRALSIRKFPGIGRVTEKLLQQVCDIHTGLDLYQKRGLVHFLFQPATAEFLVKASIGCSGEGSSFASFGAETEGSEHQKGISRERSFSPESDWALLNSRLEDIARMLATDMKRKSVVGHTITLKAKLASFDVLTRSQSQKQGIYIQNQEELTTIARKLFVAIRAQHKNNHNKKCSKEGSSSFSIRLLGIRCSNLIEESSFQAKQKGMIKRFFTVTPLGDNKGSGNEQNYMTKENDEVNCNATRKLMFNRYAKNQNGKEVNSADIFSTNSSSTKNAVINVDSPINIKKKIKTDLNTQTEHTVDTYDVQQQQDEEANEEHVSCPLCNRSFLTQNNAKLNAHIDACLNGDTVRQVIREQNCKEVPKSRKRQRLTDFWS